MFRGWMGTGLGAGPRGPGLAHLQGKIEGRAGLLGFLLPNPLSGGPVRSPARVQLSVQARGASEVVLPPGSGDVMGRCDVSPADQACASGEGVSDGTDVGDGAMHWHRARVGSLRRAVQPQMSV